MGTTWADFFLDFRRPTPTLSEEGEFLGMGSVSLADKAFTYALDGVYCDGRPVHLQRAEEELVDVDEVVRLADELF
jgi:hypothetical protein